MTRLAVRNEPEFVLVVIPAHDEEALLPACLDSVQRAAAAARRLHPHLVVEVVVVADRCTDTTADIAADRVGTHLVQVSAGAVGAARRAGVAHGIEVLGPAIPSRVWVASTDADSVVPEHWLLAHLMFARFGFAMVVGSVRPVADDLDPGLLLAWQARHVLSEGHPHVHGANLGVALDVYLGVGGFPPSAEHEDVLLVAAVKRAGFRWCATAAATVSTSGRRVSRTPGGFAGYLSALADTAS